MILPRKGLHFVKLAVAVAFCLGLGYLLSRSISLKSEAISSDYFEKLKSHIPSIPVSFGQSPVLDAPGLQLRPGDVKISYVESESRQGSPGEITDINMKKWQETMKKKIKEPKDFDIETIRPPADPANYHRERATILSLVRNNELTSIVKSIEQIEAKFNSKFQYPYTFINEQPFSNKFKERVSSLTKAEINFVHIPHHIWRKPFDIDGEREKAGIEYLLSEDVAYSDVESYHNMCRFYSGNVFKMPELAKYKYYWRIEPGVKYFSDIKYDVFKYLAGTGKVYGFTIALYDSPQSVKTLFPETLKFLSKDDNYKYVNPNGAFQWVTENKQNPKHNELTGGYSTCHFWSNFEIADMDFFRSDAYSKWFDHLESTGKFYYERWGDAPVHSLGVALFADKKRVHWFRDIGYFHFPYYNCPNAELTSGCNVDQFDQDRSLADQNCLGTWLQFELDADTVY